MTEAEDHYFAALIGQYGLEQESKSSLGTEPSLVEIKQTMVDLNGYATVAKYLEVAMMMAKLIVVGVLGCAIAGDPIAVKNLDAVKRKNPHLLMAFTNSVMV